MIYPNIPEQRSLSSLLSLSVRHPAEGEEKHVQITAREKKGVNHPCNALDASDDDDEEEKRKLLPPVKPSTTAAARMSTVARKGSFPASSSPLRTIGTRRSGVSEAEEEPERELLPMEEVCLLHTLFCSSRKRSSASIPFPAATHCSGQYLSLMVFRRRRRRRHRRRRRRRRRGNQCHDGAVRAFVRLAGVAAAVRRSALPLL
jgi:hypothetical protein